MRIALAISSALVVTISVLGFPSVTNAAPASGEWTFTGSVTAPERSEGQVEVTVSGTVIVSQGLLDQAAFTQSCALPDIPQVVPALINSSSRVITPLTVGGLALIPIDDTAPTSVNAVATTSAGSYELVLQFRCSNESSWTGNVSASPSATVTIASLVGTQYRTLSCLATSPPTQCTINQAQITSVPSGTEVTLGAVIVKTWSDGATTTTTPVETQKLMRTTVSSSTYYTTLSTNCNYTVEVTSDYKYRCEVGAQVFDPVVLQVVSPTSTYVLGLPSVTPAFAAKDQSVTVRGSVQQVYADGSRWPASTSTRFSIEFQASGKSTWSTVVSTRNITAAGSYVGAFRMSESGLVRAKVDSTTSSPVTLTLLESSNTYRIGDLTLPASTPPKQMVPMAATIQSLWSDNTYRDAPDGTSASLEFAASFDRTASSTLTWQSISTAKVSSGRVSFTPTPQASGFWRVSVGTTRSTARYLEVVGSAPISLTSTIRPDTGEVPFVDGRNQYVISASLTGYVGSETVTLFADLGGGMQRVAPFGSNNAVSGTYTLTNGPTRGSVTVTFQARDPRGAVLAQFEGNAIELDEIKDYTLTAVVPEGSVREGYAARINVFVSATSHRGLLVTVPWSGRVEIQKRVVGSWKTVATVKKARGDRLRIKVTDISSGAYRVKWADKRAYSAKFSFNVLKKTSNYLLSGTKASDRSIEVGDRSTLTATMRVQYENGKYYRALGASQVNLQYLSGSTWKTDRSISVKNGKISTSVRPGGTRSYRFVTSTGVASAPVTISVTAPRPSRLVVDWPNSYYFSVGANFTMVIRTTTGAIWTGTTPLRLEYRFSSSQPWILLDTATYRGRRLSWGWGSGPARLVYFRVSAPSLGLSDSESYY